MIRSRLGDGLGGRRAPRLLAPRPPAASPRPTASGRGQLRFRRQGNGARRQRDVVRRSACRLAAWSRERGGRTPRLDRRERTRRHSAPSSASLGEAAVMGSVRAGGRPIASSPPAGAGAAHGSSEPSAATASSAGGMLAGRGRFRPGRPSGSQEQPGEQVANAGSVAGGDGLTDLSSITTRVADGLGRCVPCSTRARTRRRRGRRGDRVAVLGLTALFPRWP